MATNGRHAGGARGVVAQVAAELRRSALPVAEREASAIDARTARLGFERKAHASWLEGQQGLDWRRVISVEGAIGGVVLG